MKINITKLSILVLCLFIGLYITFRVGFAHHFTLENIQANSKLLCNWVSYNYVISVFIYIITYFIVIASSIPITAPVSMIGGFLFGVWPTVIYSTVAATGGATVAFLLFKSVSQATIERKYGAKLASFRGGVEQYGAWYLLIIHFMFIFPFVVINMLAAVSGVSLWGFIWSTAIGFLPCAIVYAFAGKEMLSVRSFGEIFSWKIILAIVLLVLVVSLPIIINHFKKTK